MVSKAAARLGRVRMLRCLQSEKRRRSLVTFRRAFQCDFSNKNQIGKLQTGYWRYWWVPSCESTDHSRIWVVKVETRFFDDGYDGRQFESQRVRARAE